MQIFRAVRVQSTFTIHSGTTSENLLFKHCKSCTSKHQPTNVKTDHLWSTRRGEGESSLFAYRMTPFDSRLERCYRSVSLHRVLPTCVGVGFPKYQRLENFPCTYSNEPLDGRSRGVIFGQPSSSEREGERVHEIWPKRCDMRVCLVANCSSQRGSTEWWSA